MMRVYMSCLPLIVISCLQDLNPLNIVTFAQGGTRNVITFTFQQNKIFDATFLIFSCLLVFSREMLRFPVEEVLIESILEFVAQKRWPTNPNIRFNFRSDWMNCLTKD